MSCAHTHMCTYALVPADVSVHRESSKVLDQLDALIKQTGMFFGLWDPKSSYKPKATCAVSSWITLPTFLTPPHPTWKSHIRHVGTFSPCLLNVSLRLPCISEHKQPCPRRWERTITRPHSSSVPLKLRDKTVPLNVCRVLSVWNWSERR